MNSRSKLGFVTFLTFARFPLVLLFFAGAIYSTASDMARYMRMLLAGGMGDNARVISNATQAHFENLSAVLAGVADLRRVIEEASERRRLYHKRTILFVDEVHRWNRAQQDALLPHVETGLLTFIGATTQNPYFDVIKALVSRSRIFELRPLTEADIPCCCAGH